MQKADVVYSANKDSNHSVTNTDAVSATKGFCTLGNYADRLVQQIYRQTSFVCVH